MKRNGFVVMVMLLLVLGVSAQGNLLVNGGFEDGDTGQMTGTPIPGWNTWNWSGWHHDDAGKTIDTKAVKLWWSDSGYWQDFAAAEGQTYTFSGYMAHFSDDALADGDEGPGTGDKMGVFKAEWYDADWNQINYEIWAEISKDSTVDEYLLYSADIVAPVGAVTGRFVIAMEASMGKGSVNYDNASVVPEPATLAILAMGGLFLRGRRK